MQSYLLCACFLSPKVENNGPLLLSGNKMKGDPRQSVRFVKFLNGGNGILQTVVCHGWNSLGEIIVRQAFCAAM